MDDAEANTINEFLLSNWDAWSLFCEQRGVDPYSDVFDFSPGVEFPEDNSCQICGEDGGTSCGAVNCGY